VILEVARGLSLFSYRHGPLVFIFEEKTGVVIAFGPSLLYARQEASRLIEANRSPKVLEACKALNALLNVGRKPRLKK